MAITIEDYKEFLSVSLKGTSGCSLLFSIINLAAILPISSNSVE